MIPGAVADSVNTSPNLRDTSIYFCIEPCLQGVCLETRLVRNCRQDASLVPSVLLPSGKQGRVFREKCTPLRRLRASGAGENPEAVRRRRRFMTVEPWPTGPSRVRRTGPPWLSTKTPPPTESFDFACVSCMRCVNVCV